MTLYTWLVIAGFLSAPTSVAAQQSDADRVLNRLDAVEAAIRALEKQLGELNTLMRASRLPPSSPPRVEDVQPFNLNVANAASKGSANAKIAIIEFSDFQCPFCGSHAQNTLPDLEREFVETGRIKYVFMNFPIERIHPFASKAAEAAECVREQGKLWNMHDLLFASQQALALVDLFKYAQALEIDQKEFQACLSGAKMAGRIQNDLAEGRRLGITGTPTFFLGDLDEKGIVRVSRKIVGTQSLPVFQTAIESLLGAPTSGSVK
jgi:protein-disulfide isomerase